MHFKTLSVYSMTGFPKEGNLLKSAMSPGRNKCSGKR
jgi:hypothetical protein